MENEVSCVDVCDNIVGNDIYYTFSKVFPTNLLISNGDLRTHANDTMPIGNTIRHSPIQSNVEEPNSIIHIVENTSVPRNACRDDNSLSKLWNVAKSEFLLIPCRYAESIHSLQSDASIDKSPVTPKFECSVCNSTFAKLLTCLLHYKHVHKLFKCSLCDKVFRQQYSLKTHILVHSNRLDFVCSSCPRKFKRRSELQRHIERIHSLKAIRENETFNCDKCSYQTRSKRLIRSHVAVHIGTLSCICEICGKQCTNSSEFTDHRNRHSGTKSYSCHLCGSAFARKQSMLFHQKTQHEDVCSYQCDICGRLFLYKASFDCHIKLHKGENRITCELCNRILSSKAALISHKKTHTGDREFVCSICGKMYINKNSLQDHLFVHTGSKPFQCLLCDKSFTMRKKLLNHERIHDQFRRVHRCNVCSKSYLSRYKLKMHIMEKH